MPSSHPSSSKCDAAESPHPGSWRSKLTLGRLTAALVLLGLFWRVYRYALGLPIWGDEAFVAVNFVLRDFAGMWHPLVYGQIAPLGFMWVELAVSRVLGLSEWSLHLFPLTAGLVALWTYRGFALQVLPRSAAMLAIGIFAGSYFIVRHSTEVKPYSTDLLISLGLIIVGWSVAHRPHSLRRWVGLIVLAGTGVWFSYPSVFTGGAVGLLLTWRLFRIRSDRRLLLGWAVYSVVLCGSTLAMYVLYARPHAQAASALFDVQTWARTFPPLREPWKLPLWFYRVHLGNLFAYPQGGSAPGSVVTFVLFVVGAWRLGHKNGELLLLLLAPFLLNIVAAALHTYPYGGAARVAQHLAPMICLLAGLGWSVLLRRFLHGVHLRRGVIISVVGLMIIPVVSMVRSTVHPYKSITVKRSRDAVLNIAQQGQAGDLWVVFNADRPVSYAPYLGDWHGTGGQFVFDVLRFAPGPVTWAPPADTVTCVAGHKTWFLVFYTRREGIRFPQEKLDVYLSTLQQWLGKPTHQSFIIREPRRGYESLEVYRFCDAGTRREP